MVAPRVFLDFTVDGAPLGRVIFELFNVSASRTAENFRALCTGERGVSPMSQISLYYKHSTMHRVISDFMIQGGDFTKGNGTGGESIYGGPFADEDLSRPVDEAGLLVMANKGPNTNNSQFFITLRPCPHLSGKHVVFGRVLRGFDDVVQRIAAVPTDAKDRPTVPVEVANCGELELRRPPAPARQRAEAESDSVDSEKEGKRRRHRHDSYSRSHSRSRSRSRSRTPTSEENDSEAERKHRKKRARKEKKEKKSKKRKHLSPSRSRSRSVGAGEVHVVPREETEEEYDARLEREESERIEAARLHALAEVKRRYEADRAKAQADAAAQNGGVRYKGRGRMKYIDPEMRSRRNDD